MTKQCAMRRITTLSKDELETRLVWVGIIDLSAIVWGIVIKWLCR